MDAPLFETSPNYIHDLCFLSKNDIDTASRVFKLNIALILLALARQWETVQFKQFGLLQERNKQFGRL